MKTSREIRVQPVRRGPGYSINEDVITRLSDLDLLMPKLYVHMIEVFSLPPGTDKEQIVSNLTRGLSLTLGDYPVLAGTLHFDNDTKRILVKTGHDASAGLYVRGIDGHDDVGVDSFSNLDKHDFSTHLFDPAKVLPATFVGTFPVPSSDISTEGPPVCGFQVTFIEGGLVLGLAMTHQVCDGPGCEGVLASWARHSAAISRGDADGASPTGEFPSRDILTYVGEPISREAWEDLGAKFPSNKTREAPPAPPPADFKMPVVKSRVWHFPKSKLAELKTMCAKDCKTGTGYISTYDALLAVLWRALVRAKQPLVQPAPDAPSRTVHAVNARGRTRPEIPSAYIGVGVTMPQSEALTVADVLGGDLEATLPLLAHAVRATTSQVTPEYVDDLVRFAANAPDLRWTELDSMFLSPLLSSYE